MKKLYIMIDDVLKMSIVVDKTVILYKEYLYTESVLDILYAKVVAHRVDSAVVIYKGILSRNNFIESYKIFNFTINNTTYDCYLSKFDVNKIINLLKTANVRDIRILDKFGYFVTLNKIKYKDCCMIDTIGNAYVVITFLDKIRDIVYNKYSNLEKILINNNKKYAITKYLDMTTYYDEDLLSYFDNSHTLLEKLNNPDNMLLKDSKIIRVLSALSVFAFSELPGSKYFEVDVNNLNLIGANPIREEDDFDNEELESDDKEIASESPDIDKEILDSSNDNKDENTAEEKSKDEKEENAELQKQSPKKKEKNPPSKAIVAANVTAAVFSLFLIAGTFYSDKVAKTYEEKIGLANDQYESNLSSIDSINTTLTDYEQFSQDLENTSPYGTMFSNLVKINKKLKVSSVAFDGTTMNAQFTITEKNKKARKKLINKVVKKLGNDFVVQSYTTTVNKNDVQFNTYLNEK